jgi:hypothetical protein
MVKPAADITVVVVEAVVAVAVVAAIVVAVAATLPIRAKRLNQLIFGGNFI